MTKKTKQPSKKSPTPTRDEEIPPPPVVQISPFHISRHTTPISPCLTSILPHSTSISPLPTSISPLPTSILPQQLQEKHPSLRIPKYILMRSEQGIKGSI